MKKIIIILGFLLVTLLGYGQVPTPNSANNNTYCLNDVQVYGDQIIDPLAAYTFSIVPAVPFTLISSDDQIQVTWSVAGIYTINITKTIGLCSSTSSATITVLPPTIPIVIVDAICQGNGTINLTSNPLGTNPVFAGTGVVGSVFNATGLATGVYPITFTSTDANGCPMTGNGSITITPPPSTPIIYTD
jgi:hypothetical protein